MIRIYCAGGLGNQLFIWNLAHILENKFQKRVWIVFPPLRKTGRSEIELTLLSKYCQHKIDIQRSFFFDFMFKVKDRLLARTKTLERTIEKIFGIFDSRDPESNLNFNLYDPKYVRGYFQSVPLVTEGWNLIRQEILSCATDLKCQYEIRFPANFPQQRYQALHIRRGDYLKMSDSVGLLSLDYYKENMDLELPLYICTDEKNQSNRIGNFFTEAKILKSNELSAWETFSFLMHAEKLIIANSTFSWWAAMFVLERGGEVIAPRPWTRKEVFSKEYLVHDAMIHRTSSFEVE